MYLFLLIVLASMLILFLTQRMLKMQQEPVRVRVQDGRRQRLDRR